MRIAITGASGLVGRQLVPILLESGATVMLIGRSPEQLAAEFPGINAVGYDDIATAANGYDRLLHLAVMNNTENAEWERFQRVNVELVEETYQQAALAGIREFILASSTHALDLKNDSHYARSKRLAVEFLDNAGGIARRVLYLPAVVGKEFGGKLRILNKVPVFARGALLAILGSLRPTVTVGRIANVVLEPPLPEGDQSYRAGIVSEGQLDNLFFRAAKRALDIAFSLAILIFLWWAMILVWLGVRLQSPGPGIFMQERVGRNETTFTCYKFRTMYVTAPNVGTHEVSASAVTPFGQFLRRTKLDELPQVLNILRNEMSLVGPRPSLPTQAAVVDERRKLGVLMAKPGITGFAQIRGLDMSDPVELAASDRQYLDLQSLVLDAKIIVRTALGGGSGDRVRSTKSQI